MLQIMDQVFGALKADYTQRMANARVVSSGRSLDLQGRIRVWCALIQGKRGCGADHGRRRQAGLVPGQLGGQPGEPAQAHERTSSGGRGRRRRPVSARCAAAATMHVAGMKRSRVSDITDAADALLGDAPTDADESDDEAEAARQPKKSRRVNYEEEL